MNKYECIAWSCLIIGLFAFVSICFLSDPDKESPENIYNNCLNKAIGESNSELLKNCQIIKGGQDGK